MIDVLVGELVALGGSDLHLKVGSVPAARMNGELVRLEDYNILRPEDTEGLLADMMPPFSHEVFARDGEADFSYIAEDVGRLRVNAFRQRGSVSIVMRIIPFEVPNLDNLALPDAISKLSGEERGLVFVTGSTGSGKSTTLAAMIDRINRSEAKHIVTIEDPIEFLHKDKLSIINQREVGQDTASFSQALRRALRQDPDVILVGEIRDAETARIALSAAETGHLVLSTLHTMDTTETVNRMIDLFPPGERGQVRAMLSGTLKGVIGQRLVRTKDGEGRAAAVEVMITTGRVRDYILDPEKTDEIQEVISEGEYYGMQTYDQALLKLVAADLVTFETALQAASQPQNFRLMVQTLGSGLQHSSF